MTGAPAARAAGRPPRPRRALLPRFRSLRPVEWGRQSQGAAWGYVGVAL